MRHRDGLPGRSSARAQTQTLALGLVLVLMAATRSLAASSASDRSSPRPFEGWTSAKGKWAREGGAYAQTEMAADCRSFAPAADWADCVYEVKARKTGGTEGFLILFRVKDKDHFYWWNIGGWGNAQHGVEARGASAGFPRVPGKVDTGRWYDVRVVVQGASIRCYLDGELIHDVADAAYGTGGIGLGAWNTQVEYKDVTLLRAARAGKQALDAKPRMDMPGGVAVAQQRNFGKLY